MKKLFFLSIFFISFNFACLAKEDYKKPELDKKYDILMLPAYDRTAVFIPVLRSWNVSKPAQVYQSDGNDLIILTPPNQEKSKGAVFNAVHLMIIKLPSITPAKYMENMNSGLRKICGANYKRDFLQNNDQFISAIFVCGRPINAENAKSLDIGFEQGEVLVSKAIKVGNYTYAINRLWIGDSFEAQKQQSWPINQIELSEYVQKIAAHIEVKMAK